MFSRLTKKIFSFNHMLIQSVRLLANFGVRTSYYYFFGNILPKKNDKLRREYHRKLYDELKRIVRKKYGYLIREYNNKKNTHNNSLIEKRIWIIWWQGIENSPPGKIAENIDIIKQLNHDWNITTIDKDNYSDYVDVPQHIDSLIKNKKISFTHISDYIRVLLLEKYGGVYVDANFLALAPFERIINNSFYSIKHGLFKDWHVCKGLWTTGFMASSENNILFSFLKDLYEHYFKNYSFIPSFFFIDALIGLGYENVINIKNEIDSVPNNNSHYNFINEHGNEIYDAKLWNNIVKDTFLLNVSYKNNFVVTNNGKETFFGNLYK